MLGYTIDWGEGGTGEATDNGLPPNPPNIYGATKAWGEALCRKYSNSDGLSCVALRVRGTSLLSLFSSPAFVVSAFSACASSDAPQRCL